jgi:hypothetical protein
LPARTLRSLQKGKKTYIKDHYGGPSREANIEGKNHATLEGIIEFNVKCMIKKKKNIF